jgi:hypothetical protein
LVEVHCPAHHLDYLGHMVGLLGMLVMLKSNSHNIVIYYTI